MNDMQRLIDANALKEKLGDIRLDYDFGIPYDEETIRDFIDDATTIDPVKHGRWVRGIPITCSVCGEAAIEEKNGSVTYGAYITDCCPSCGAKMDLEE